MSDRMLEQVIRVIVSTCIVPVPKEQIREDTDLLTDLGLESIQIVELVLSLEEEFGIEFDDDDLNPDNFQIVGSIVRTIELLTENATS